MPYAFLSFTLMITSYENKKTGFPVFSFPGHFQDDHIRSDGPDHMPRDADFTALLAHPLAHGNDQGIDLTRSMIEFQVCMSEDPQSFGPAVIHDFLSAQFTQSHWLPLPVLLMYTTPSKIRIKKTGQLLLTCIHHGLILDGRVPSGLINAAA